MTDTEPTTIMFTSKLLHILFALPPVWVHEHHTFTAPGKTSTHVGVSVVHMQESGYELLQRADNVAFMHNLDTRDRVEIIPNNNDYVPHHAFAFQTSEEYSKAIIILKSRDDLNIKVFKKSPDSEDLLWVIFSYTERGRTHYVQFLWRKEPIFPDLPWPE